MTASIERGCRRRQYCPLAYLADRGDEASEVKFMDAVALEAGMNQKLHFTRLFAWCSACGGHTSALAKHTVLHAKHTVLHADCRLRPSCPTVSLRLGRLLEGCHP